MQNVQASRPPTILQRWPAGMPFWLEKRVTDARHLEMALRLPEFESKAAWERRARDVRDRILLAAGLRPAPPSNPLRARIFDRKVCDGYTVEKVCFESLPGFLCTGNLYRPIGVRGRAPAVLNPHGHWARGRLHHEPARGSVPGRVIGLAKLGFVAFSYDMVGAVDSLQFRHRPDVLGERASLWGLSLMGLQLRNGMRAVDFLRSLPDVDPERIGCTGGSGGGSQTFFLTAVDARIKAAVPVCMVSDHMQGGCVCENGPSLRIGTSSVEIAACAAPRPMLLVASTQDWTNQTLEHELPEIRRIYRFYGAAGRVAGVRFDAPHNYNRDGCEAMFAWFARWLKGDRNAGRAIRHPEYSIAPESDLRVFPDGRLPAGIKRQRPLVDHLRASRRDAIARALPAAPAGLARYRRRYGAVLRETLAVEMPRREDVCVDVTCGETDVRGGRAALLWIARRGAGDCIPSAIIRPPDWSAEAGVTLLVHPRGTAGFFRGRRCLPEPLPAALLRRRQCLFTFDPYLTGEQAGLAATAAGYRSMRHFHAYNRSVAAQRVQDVLTALGALVHYYRFKRVNLVGWGAGGVWALLARAVRPGFERTSVDLAGAPVDSDAWWERHAFIPLIRQAGDLTTAIALGAPAPLRVYGAHQGFPAEPARACYRAAGKPGSLLVSDAACNPETLAAWIAGA